MEIAGNNGQGETKVRTDARAARVSMEAALFEMRRAVVGQEALLERVLVALLTGGHLLIEGVPGLAKTLTVKTAAAVLGGSFSRVQFTPDLVPADLVGTRVFRPDTATFATELGPVFCNFLLADEINRAPAKVQSALLEVMQEHQVSIGSETFGVPDPFLVMATQNPIESEGTYPLPEAQLDRFAMKVLVGYPSREEEAMVVDRSMREAPEVRKTVTPAQLGTFRRAAASVYVDRLIVEYAVDLCAATREPHRHGLGELASYLDFGASPRGPINLVRASQAVAFLRDRDYVLAQDVRIVAKDVLRHRLVLSYEAMAEGVDADVILDEILGTVPAPRLELSSERAGA